jgi:tryptophan synthase alpha chain
LSRIPRAFERARSEDRAALLAYLMAGDPKLEATEALARACARGGADVLEIGIPFSDPIADGPEIQAAAVRSLRAGTKPKDVLASCARLRKDLRIPLVLMTYLNPILAMGMDGFAAKAKDAGVDGVIFADVPLEESAEIRAVLDDRGIDHIQLVAPSTSANRARAIGRVSRGFLYVVSRYGTTGTRTELSEGLGDRLAALRTTTDLPLAVGFGVSTTDHVRSLVGMGADGVVVGSAIVRTIAEDPRPETVEKVVAGLASGLRG